MWIFDLLFPMLPADIGRDIGEGSRAIERDHNDDILEGVRLQLFQILPHPGRFELEYSGRVAVSEYLEHFPVLIADLEQIDADIMIILHNLEATVDDRKVPESEEVHLQQSQIFKRILRKLRYSHRVVFRRMLKAAEIRHLLGSDDNRTGVHSKLTDRSFEPDCIVNDLLVLFRREIELLEFSALIECIADLDSRLRRDELRDVVHLREGDTERPSDILDGSSRGHRSESAYLGHMILTVFIPDILKYERAPFIREIDVDIRHRYSRRIQEPFEKQ